MKKIKLGIIGLGAIGERLIKVLKTYDKMEIFMVYDHDLKRMEEMASLYDLPCVDGVDQMLESQSLDAVYLAVPPKFHKDLALKIMRAGKDLLCEKPLADTVENAKIMYDVSKETSVTIGMNFPLPYTGAYHYLQDHIKKNEMGSLMRIEVHGQFPDWPRKWQINPWIDTRAEGGFVREVFTHLIQVIISMYGPIENIQSRAQYPSDPTLSEIGVLAFGNLLDGTMVSFNGLSGMNEKEHLSLKFIYEKGSLEMVNWRQLFLVDQNGKREVDLEAVDATKVLFDHFYKGCLNEPSNLVDFKIGYETVKIVETLLNNYTEKK